MARYCFYCGRALKSGEKCGCRSSVKENQAQPQSAKKTGWSERIKRFFQSARPVKNKTGFRSFRLRRKPDLQLGKRFMFYLTRPADAAGQVTTAADTYIAILLLLIIAVLGGLFLISGLRQPQLMLILSLNTATASANTITQSYWFMFVQGFGFCLAIPPLLVLLYQIVLKTVFRIQLGFTAILTSFNPSLFFTGLFLLAGLFALASSVFSSLLTLIAGFAAAVLLQYLALRQISRLDGNRCFLLIIFVQILLTSILALLFNLALPVLSALLDHSVVI